MTPRRLKPGNTPTAGDFNSLLSLVESVVQASGTAFGDIGTSMSAGGVQVLDGRLKSHWGRITGRGTGNNYSHISVAPNGDGAWTDLPAEGNFQFGTTTITPAREVSGRTDVPADGTVIRWLTPDEQEVGGFEFVYDGLAGGGTANGPSDCRVLAYLPKTACLVFSLVSKAGLCAGVTGGPTALIYSDDEGAWLSDAPFVTDTGSWDVLWDYPNGGCCPRLRFRKLMGTSTEVVIVTLRFNGCFDKGKGAEFVGGGPELCGGTTAGHCADNEFLVRVECDPAACYVSIPCCPAAKLFPRRMCIVFACGTGDCTIYNGNSVIVTYHHDSGGWIGSMPDASGFGALPIAVTLQPCFLTDGAFHWLITTQASGFFPCATTGVSDEVDDDICQLPLHFTMVPSFDCPGYQACTFKAFVKEVPDDEICLQDKCYPDSDFPGSPHTLSVVVPNGPYAGTYSAAQVAAQNWAFTRGSTQTETFTTTTPWTAYAGVATITFEGWSGGCGGGDNLITVLGGGGGGGGGYVKKTDIHVTLGTTYIVQIGPGGVGGSNGSDGGVGGITKFIGDGGDEADANPGTGGGSGANGGFYGQGGGYGGTGTYTGHFGGHGGAAGIVNGGGGGGAAGNAANGSNGNNNLGGAGGAAGGGAGGDATVAGTAPGGGGGGANAASGTAKAGASGKAKITYSVLPINAAIFYEECEGVWKLSDPNGGTNTLATSAACGPLRLVFDGTLWGSTLPITVTGD